MLFDDLHQGLGAAYDPDKFYKDRRLYVTIGVLRGAVARVGAGLDAACALPVSSTSAPREAELVRAAGGFCRACVAGACGRAAAARQFLPPRERARAAAGATAPCRGTSSSAIPRVAPADLEQLKGWYAEAHASRRVPLDRLQNLIVRIDRQMAT